MLSIESAHDRLRQRRRLFRICHQHCRPRDGLKNHPIEADREAKDENDEAATD